MGLRCGGGGRSSRLDRIRKVEEKVNWVEDIKEVEEVVD